MASVALHGRFWSIQMSPMAFGVISAELARKLLPPSCRLPPYTRLSLSAGRQLDHLIVELPPPVTPSDKLAAPATKTLSVPLPARTVATASPQRPGPVTSAAAVRDAPGTQQDTPATEQAAGQRGNADAAQQRKQGSSAVQPSAAKRRKLAPAAQPAATAGGATQSTPDGSARASAAAPPRSSIGKAAKATAVRPRHVSLPARPLHTAANGAHTQQPAQLQKPAQPARHMPQASASEAHLYSAPLLACAYDGVEGSCQS